MHLHNSSSSFYIILPSNTKVDGNKTNSFRVRLPQKLEFNSEWNVGLAVLVYPHTWPSLGTVNSQFIKVEWQTGDVLRIEIPSSSFKNPVDLTIALNELLIKGHSELAERLAQINKKLVEVEVEAARLTAQDVEKIKSETEDVGTSLKSNSRFRFSPSQMKQSLSNETTKESIQKKHYENLLVKKIPDPSDRLLLSKIKALGGSLSSWINSIREVRNVCKFIFSQERQRFSVSFDQSFIKSLELSEQLSYVMGFFPAIVLTEPKQDAKFVPDMTGGVSSFNIYAPGLVEPVMIGDITAPLLRMVNIKGSADEIVEENYVAIQYHRMLVKEVSEICIEIRSASGSLMPFLYGTCTLTLHFKKAPYF